MKRYTAFYLLPLLILFFSSCSDDGEQAILEHPLTAFEDRIGEWAWLDVEGMICRDSSTTGIAVRLGSNTSKWMIYLQGGGACFTPSTCASNPANFDDANFFDNETNGFYDGGLFNNLNENNPVKDWNIIFIPYCTGDVHVGLLEDGLPLGGTEKQQYVGNRNINLALDFLKPYMEKTSIDELMVAGISAGGFGTHITFFEAKDRFPNVKTHLLNDSGPLISDAEILPACLNLGFIFLYNIPVPEGYLFCCQPSYGLADIYTLAPRLYPNDNFGLMSHTEDDVIRFFFAAGQNNCTGGEVSGEAFKQGLQNLREDVLKPTGKWATFYTAGEEHTFVQTDSRFYNTQVDGVPLYDWVKSVMEGNVSHLEE